MILMCSVLSRLEEDVCVFTRSSTYFKEPRLVSINDHSVCFYRVFCIFIKLLDCFSKPTKEGDRIDVGAEVSATSCQRIIHTNFLFISRKN